MRKKSDFVPKSVLESSKFDFEVLHFLDIFLDSVEFGANSADEVLFLAHFNSVFVEFDVDPFFKFEIVLEGSQVLHFVFKGVEFGLDVNDFFGKGCVDHFGVLVRLNISGGVS